jgi:short-subunit dehydrogenase
MPQERPGTALVTGASSGIGRELARLHAAAGGDLVVVARRADRLAALKDEIERAFAVAVHPLPIDLTEPEAAARIAAFLDARGLAIDVLVNNAGIGGRGLFRAGSPEHDRAMIRLNVEAPATLCRLLLPGMIARGHGRILNVGSIVGFAPGPRLAVYAATKAFLLSFSEALAEELAGTGVTATLLAPGLTATEFHAAAGIVPPGEAARGGRPARAVAEAGYAAMLAGKRIAFAETTTAVAAALPRLLPRRWVAAIAARLAARAGR